ncbi:MAG: TetR/AcrR family transcriptional regulator [Marinilabiliaceae bacterium]|nr:TetR/AcrR family transcriptional regulator [Marinilabiliaceae bacterium]
MDQNNISDNNESVKNAILEVARNLFSKYGYKKTTMEDIAQALGKGKSSLYYYFKNKEDIFQAVIDWEEDILFSSLREIIQEPVSADKKMEKYIEVRMETIRELENYHKAINTDSNSNFDFLDYIKGKSEQEEALMIEQIMQEGLNSNIFAIKNPQMAAIAISTALKGLEIPLFRTKPQMQNDDFKVQLKNVLNILFYGLIKRP